MAGKGVRAASEVGGDETIRSLSMHLLNILIRGLQARVRGGG